MAMAEEFSRVSFGMIRELGYVPWLKVGKIGAHLVCAAFFCPRLYRSVVRVEQHQTVLFFRSLITNTDILQILVTKEEGGGAPRSRLTMQ